MNLQLKLSEDQEMFLERLWCLKEKGRDSRSLLIGSHEHEARARMLWQLIDLRLLAVDGERVEFTSEGRVYAQDVIRRRRLTEVLLYNVLNLKLSTAEASACKIEHIINDEVTDSICAFLGHPLQCPHGQPIPRGGCCKRTEEELQPLIQPLKNIAIGKKARVVFIKAEDRGIINRLMSLGVHPGALINVRQLKPAVIISAGETEVALDPYLLEGIFCRPVSA